MGLCYFTVDVHLSPSLKEQYSLDYKEHRTCASGVLPYNHKQCHLLKAEIHDTISDEGLCDILILKLDP